MRRNVRARDVDRAATGTMLDNAYAEGQLTYDEHRLRSGRAREAVTLEDLDGLAADLQKRSFVPPKVVRRRSPSLPWLRKWLVGAAVLALLGAMVWSVLRSGGSDDDSTAAPAASTTTSTVPPTVTPIVAPRVDFTTAAGFAEFVTLFRAHFGDTLVDGLSVYPDDGYASFSRAEEVDRERDFSFRGGFDPGTLSARAANTQVIDISAISADGYATVQQAAIDQIGFRDGVISHITFRLGRTGPEMLVYVSNDVGQSNYVTADFDGLIRPGR